MAITNVFKTATATTSPLDGFQNADPQRSVSDFLTVQSFTNFAAMTGAISAAWQAIQRLWPEAASLWVPYAFAGGWAIVSILISLDGLRKADGSGKLDAGTVLGAVFVGLINSLVLAGAVVGTQAVVTGGQVTNGA